MKANGKKIAENTLLLYFRMFLVLVTTLYTSRIVLQLLGVDDYGVYQTVGGVVSFLAMANGALSAGTSRFLTFEMGRNNDGKLQEIFSLTLINHILMAILVVLVAETIGLWFVKNNLTIPADRMDSALFVYHVSVTACFFLLTQAPYTAVIVAREKMGIYAYVSIVEVFLKLLSAFLLQFISCDKLKVYAVFVLCIQLVSLFVNRIYCIRKFPESRFKFYFEKGNFFSIMKFSSWNLLMQGSASINNQGFLILTNMFFGPAIVAARSIALQVNSAANQFVNNFRLAANPQIVKLLANGSVQESHKLLLQSTKFTFFLMLVVAVPVVIGAKALLTIWLGQVPEYCTIFLQLVIIQSLFSALDVSFHTALHAVGKLKEEAIMTPIIDIVFFCIVFLFFSFGSSPIVLSVLAIIQFFVLGCVVKPFLICKVASYSYSEVFLTVFECFKVSLVPAIYVSFCLLGEDSDCIAVFGKMLCGVIVVILCCYFGGMDASLRQNVNIKLRHALKK